MKRGERRVLALLDRRRRRSPRSCRPCARAPRASRRPSLYRSAGVCTMPPSTSWSTSLSPRPSMSSARRLAKCSSACLRCAGQTSPPVQRAIASSGRRTTAEPHSGHCVGHHERAARRAAACSSDARERPRGITSPARRTTTVSPMRTSLRRTSSSLCSVALVDGDAADEHRLQPRDRRDRAGAADLHVDAERPRSSSPRPGTCARPPSAARARRSRARAAASRSSTL